MPTDHDLPLQARISDIRRRIQLNREHARRLEELVAQLLEETEELRLRRKGPSGE